MFYTSFRVWCLVPSCSAMVARQVMEGSQRFVQLDIRAHCCIPQASWIMMVSLADDSKAFPRRFVVQAPNGYHVSRIQRHHSALWGPIPFSLKAHPHQPLPHHHRPRPPHLRSPPPSPPSSAFHQSRLERTPPSPQTPPS